MVMIRLTLIVFLFIFSLHSHAFISISVSQTILQVDDTIEFRVKIDGDPSSLNLANLEKDFRIIRQSGSRSSTSNINGKTTITREYTLLISPNRSGDITIPSFDYNGESSQPITLKVRPAHQSVNQDDLFFLTSSIKEKNIYVDQPIILELKFHSAIDVDSLDFKLPENAQFSLKQIGNTTQDTQVINAISYNVTTLFAQITLQNPGPLYIGSFESHGRYIVNRNIKSYSALSKPFSINVKPIPAQYPKNKPWLPATDIFVRDNLTDSFNLESEENLTRIIDIQITGLTSNYLPNLDIPTVEGIKIYSEDEIKEDQIIDSKNIGLTQAKWAILPTKNGTAVLPEYSITWWDTVNEKLQVSKIKQRQINITGVSDQNKSNSQSPIIQTEVIEKAPTWIWIAIILLLVGWIITTIIYQLKLNRLKNSTSVKSEYINTYSQPNQSSVIKACQKQSLRQLKQALVDLEKQCKQDDLDYSVYTQTLSNYLQVLDNQLYKPNNNQNKQAFDFNKFEQVFKKIKAKKIETEKNKDALFNLYPSD